MRKNINPIARKSNLVVQEMETEILVYDLSINKAFCLNGTSALVWQFSDGNNSISEIADLMSKRLKTLISEEFVWLALDQLKRDNLLENNSEFEVKLNGLNRREIIRKVGLASMVALPLISSVIAPIATHAASNPLLPNGSAVGSTLVFPGTCATVPVSSLDSECNKTYGKLCSSGKAAYAGNCFNTGGPLGVSFSCVCTA